MTRYSTVPVSQHRQCRGVKAKTVTASPEQDVVDGAREAGRTGLRLRTLRHLAIPSPAYPAPTEFCSTALSQDCGLIQPLRLLKPLGVLEYHAINIGIGEVRAVELRPAEVGRRNTCSAMQSTTKAKNPRRHLRGFDYRMREVVS
jgi:hypothetical protein